MSVSHKAAEPVTVKDGWRQPCEWCGVSLYRSATYRSATNPAGWTPGTYVRITGRTAVKNRDAEGIPHDACLHQLPHDARNTTTTMGES